MMQRFRTKMSTPNPTKARFQLPNKDANAFSATLAGSQCINNGSTGLFIT
jgi:hypothetical protein